MHFGKQIFVLALAAAHAEASQQQVALNALANPIRKVVTMLQLMQKKVTEEGKQEEKLLDKFMCYCSNGGKDLASSIEAATEKIPAVSSDIESATARLSQAKQDLIDAQTSRSAAKKAVAEAKALRGKEANTFADLKAEADTNTVAMAKAITALENGMVGSFLQTPAAAILKQVVSKSSFSGMADADQQSVISFLSGTNQYAPQSGEITGILKQMLDTMKADLADAIAAEEKSISLFKGLVAAKEKEIAANSAAVEAKTEQIGSLGVSLVEMKEDLSDTQDGLKADNTFMSGLKQSCATKKSEWEERQKTRAEELVALADTIKVLNDDDALELFKKTLPSASFIQMEATAASMREQALSTIRASFPVANAADRHGLELLALTLAGKRAYSKGTFDKVTKMIDEMVKLLGDEQVEDDNKKEYCSKQFDITDDKKRAVHHHLDQTSRVIDMTAEGIESLTSEIAALTVGINKLDKSVAEATQQRNDETVEFKSLMASDTAAKEVMAFAKNRLNKFYNKALYKPAPKTELSAENRIVENMGGEVATTTPGGIADTGITVFAQVSQQLQKAAPAAPPATWDAYSSKSEESTGVIAMIDLLIKDLDKEMTEAKTDEKDSQSAYAVMMKDAAEKRTEDSKALNEKTSCKADLESELQSATEAKTIGKKEMMAIEKYEASLHAECDWLVQYFDVRKQARTDEVDALTKAKAVLSGADFSFAQMNAKHFLSRY